MSHKIVQLYIKSIPIQKPQMERRYMQLVNRTGASGGELTEIDTLLLKVMKSDKQIFGDTLASSSKPEIQITGIENRYCF